MPNAIRVKIKPVLIFHFTGTSNEKQQVHKLSLNNKKSRCSINLFIKFNLRWWKNNFNSNDQNNPLVT